MLIHSPTISVSLSIPSPCLVDTLNHTVIHIRSIIIQQHIPTQFVTPFLSPIPIPRPCHLDLMLVSCFRLVLLVRLVFLLHSITVSATPSPGLSGLPHRCYPKPYCNAYRNYNPHANPYPNTCPNSYSNAYPKPYTNPFPYPCPAPYPTPYPNPAALSIS
jgi:hypothetical protein